MGLSWQQGPLAPGAMTVADTRRPLVRYESGFAPRWYVPRDDVDVFALAPVKRQTFCAYKGVCSYYDVGGAQGAGWSYEGVIPHGVDRDLTLDEATPGRPL
jgi:uncharacterized protein (DUF427 family)